MNGLWLLVLLIVIAVLPVIPVWFAFSSQKLGSRLFILSLGAGLLSVPIAFLLQSLLPRSGAGLSGTIIFGVFIRIALVEELSRILTLLPLRKLARSAGSGSGATLPGPFSAAGAMTGLAAGLGFAVAETGFYGAMYPGAALLRTFTAAPLHGACGARAGTALAIAPEYPVRSAALFVSATLIHGMYDFFILNPGLPSFLSIPVALAALGSSLLDLRHNLRYNA
ncbi:MAG: PrsW family intramembrane metalloprotease [Treponema sp.]|jgi:RsiW-degrading membrane proteinase PrsW (M82 family)|nr:PrsW family intramembrane metalloprotease [Treponema sp.]